MNDFAELGPLMLVESPPSIACFVVAAICGVALRSKSSSKEFKHLTCGIGLWASARDLMIPFDVFLIATLSLTRNRGYNFNWTMTLMGLCQWIALGFNVELGNNNNHSLLDDIWIGLLVFVYVASATSGHLSMFRVVLAWLRCWIPRNGVFVAAVFVWTGHGGVFSRLGSALLVGLTGEYARMIFAIAGIIGYISSLPFVNNILTNGRRTATGSFNF